MKKVRKEGLKTKFFIIGLGNPGLQYKNNRHNTGYKVLDKLSSEFSLHFRSKFPGKFQLAQFLPFPSNPYQSIVLLRYSGYMNRSGEIIPGVKRKMGLNPDNLVVILDNMDIAPGLLRIKKGGGDAGHRGLRSIIHYLGSPEFLRLYVGVGRPEPGMPVVQHVLSSPFGEDEKLIDRACSRASRAILELLSDSYQNVNSRINHYGA